MIKAKVNHKYDFSIEPNAKRDIDLIEVKDGIFHIILGTQTYNAELLKANKEEKNFTIRVNGNKYTVQLKDKYDDLLKELGIDNSSAKKVKELKAPMPGLVVDVRVKAGDEVKKGDALVVLQAMKMENILKSPADVNIKKVHIQKDNTIEKNQVLITFS